MSKKRLSLAEVMSEDEQRSTAVVAPVPAKVASAPAMSVVAAPSPPAPFVAPVVTVAPVARASAPANAEVVMEKLSVTLPLEMHEQLLDMSRARRRAKEPYQLSQIVREAMGAWLAANASQE